MKIKVNDISTAIIQKKYMQYFILMILLIPFMRINFDVKAESDNMTWQNGTHMEEIASVYLEPDEVMNFLGKSFSDISLLLGEPTEKGYSEMYGPHQYIIYRYGEGYILFASPEALEIEIAQSIFLGPGQEVLGTKVGMKFSEISEILGTPEYGPEMGMDDLYYMDYTSGEINDQIPELFISFVATNIDSPTDHAFIKFLDFRIEEEILGEEIGEEN